MLAQGTGGTAFYLICATIGLVMLGMAANEWRRLGTADYRRLMMAAAVLVVGRMAGLLTIANDWQSGIACQEWALEGLTLAGFTWAYLFGTFSTQRRALLFLAIALAIVGGSLVPCLSLRWGWLSFSLPLTPWPVALLLLSGFGFIQWVRHRQQLSLWLGCAFLVSSVGAGSGLLGLQQGALLAHLAILPLFAIETYRSILADLGAYGLELQTLSKRALQQTQDLAFLLEVSQAIAASLDLTVVLKWISEAVARAVNADWAYVLLPVDDSVEELALVARYGWWGRRWMQDSQVQRRATIRLAEFPLLRHAVLRRRQVLADQPAVYEQLERLHDLLARPQGGPTLIQPLYLQDRSLGVLLLGHVGKQRTFGEADGRLCQALAGQVATAIENARLYQSVDRQARRLAELLRIREEEFTQRQEILESIADGVVVASETGDVVLTNAAAERILGIPRRQLIGQTIKQLYARLVPAGGQGAGDQTVFEWGSKVVMGSLAPVKMPDGTLLGHVAVFRDVTRERQAERAKGQFIATISHELRTPLTSIKGYIELLITGAAGSLNRQQRDFLGITHNNTNKMIRLVNNLIAVSEMEQEAIQIEPQAVDMKDVVEEAVQAICAMATEYQLDLEVNLPRDLRPARGDPERLRQIMDNLLNNAMRYTPPGGRITIWAAEANLEEEGTSSQHYLVVNIRDTGVGIPPEEHDRIFEKFYRRDGSSSGETGGTGMGLAIVKSLVEAHGGQIWVESEPGVGSTFSFTIPSHAG